MNLKKMSALAAVTGAVVFVASFLAVQSVGAEDQVKQLKLGDPAPALHVSQWVQGGPIKMADGKGKKIYVVEFWATWCPPCRMTIPHLNELYQKYKDKGLEVIAITDEPASTVDAFVKKQGDKMTYPVAIDKDSECAREYMTAFGQNGIPHAFIIGTDGKIVWHGHPMDNMEAQVEKYLPKTDPASGTGGKTPSGT